VEGEVLIMPTQVKRRSTTDTYFKLVRAFPLRRLKTSADHTKAKEIFLRLSNGKADRGTREYLDVLIDLIVDFERRSRQTIDTSTVSAADLIRHRLEERGMSLTQLAREVGIPQPNLSAMLNGDRDWSKAAIRSLSALFDIRIERFFR
jgi:hypothetical protein